MTSDDFDRRLARARQTEAPPKNAPPTPMGVAFRVGTELLAGVLVGALIGWFLDRWLGTSPWLLIVFFCFGVAAGFHNVFRAAREMNAAAQQGPTPPSAEDDEDV